jgi:hypothetical protein
MAVPFAPFVLRLEGGYEVRVDHPENIVFIPGLEFVTVYDNNGYADVFSTDRIVSLRRAGGPA